MRFLRLFGLFFTILYLALSLHYWSYDREAKRQALQSVAGVIKDVHPSVSFSYPTYRRFVYAE